MGLIETLLSILAIVACSVIIGAVVFVIVGICFAIALSIIGLFEDKL